MKYYNNDINEIMCENININIIIINNNNDIENMM